MNQPKRVAVVLCGSGFKDGSEIHESVAALWALSCAGADVQIFAPDAPQKDVVNCLTGEIALGESRNQLVEAARIARGEVAPLTALQETDFDAIILPGGFGAAKNLSSFATDGAQGSVRPELKAILHAFHRSKKPIGAICIAPVLVALSFPQIQLELTLGLEPDTAREVEKLGHKTFPLPSSQCHLDRENRVVTAPAYMNEAPVAEVFQGIHKLVLEVLRLA